MRRYARACAMALVMIAMSLSSLFSATREEAIAYYEEKYEDWLAVYRHKTKVKPGYLAPESPSVDDFIAMNELGVLSQFTEIELGNYGSIAVSWEDYYFIQDRLAQITDEEERFEEESKMATALSFSMNHDISFKCALENIDKLRKAFAKIGAVNRPPVEEEITPDNFLSIINAQYVPIQEKVEQSDHISYEEFKQYVEYLSDNYFEIP